MLHIDLIPNRLLPVVKLSVTFSFSFTVKQDVTYTWKVSTDFRQAGPIPRIMKMRNVILCVQHELNVVPGKNKSDESDVILPESISVKYAVFFYCTISWRQYTAF